MLLPLPSASWRKGGAPVNCASTSLSRGEKYFCLVICQPSTPVAVDNIYLQRPFLFLFFHLNLLNNDLDVLGSQSITELPWRIGLYHPHPLFIYIMIRMLLHAFKQLLFSFFFFFNNCNCRSIAVNKTIHLLKCPADSDLGLFCSGTG